MILLLHILAILVSNCDAQSSALTSSNPLSRDHNGWTLYNVNASFGYSTLALPAGNVPLGVSLGRLESDFDGTASASLGYSYTGAKSSVSMLYSPSLVGRVRYSQLSALNQSLALKVTRKLGRRWDFSLALAGADATLDQILFTPAVLSTVTSPVATLDDLMGAIRGGQYTSDQLASILTGTPYVATPSRSTIYGSSFLSTSLGASATYRYSPRLSFLFSTGGLRSQTRSNSQDSFQSVQNFLIPRTTTVQGSASINYQLSPRTELGVRGDATQIDSTFGRYMITKAEFLLSRKISPHWFTSVSGGPAQVTIQNPGSFAQLGTGGISYTVQGNVGYTLGKASTLIGSYGKSAGDTFGFGAQSSETIAGSWQWVLPGQSWSFYASSKFQRLEGGVLGDFRYWHTNAGFSRPLNRQTAISFSFGFVAREAGTTVGVLQQNLRGFSTRVTLVWNPFGKGESQIPGASATGVSR